MLFYIPFWVYFAVVVILAGTTIYFRKLRFIDIQILIMIIAVSMSLEMLFSKHLELYHYVSDQYKGWYSFWANLFIIPAIGLIFIKFAPIKWLKAAFYILAWVAGLTLFELFVAKPSGILKFRNWRIFPWSSAGYIVVLVWEYIYYKILERHIKQPKST